MQIYIVIIISFVLIFLVLFCIGICQLIYRKKWKCKENGCEKVFGGEYNSYNKCIKECSSNKNKPFNDVIINKNYSTQTSPLINIEDEEAKKKLQKYFDIDSCIINIKKQTSHTIMNNKKKNVSFNDKSILINSQLK